MIVATLSFRLIAIGTVLGIAATVGLTRLVRASGAARSIFDTRAWPAFAIPTIILGGVGLRAMWAPSRRARRIEPVALRRVE